MIQEFERLFIVSRLSGDKLRENDGQVRLSKVIQLIN